MCSGEQRGARSGPREPDGRVSDPGLYPGEGKGLSGAKEFDVCGYVELQNQSPI